MTPQNASFGSVLHTRTGTDVTRFPEIRGAGRRLGGALVVDGNRSPTGMGGPTSR